MIEKSFEYTVQFYLKQLYYTNAGIGVIPFCNFELGEVFVGVHCICMVHWLLKTSGQLRKPIT
jgi:hypothetical protein